MGINSILRFKSINSRILILKLKAVAEQIQAPRRFVNSDAAGVWLIFSGARSCLMLVMLALISELGGEFFIPFVNFDQSVWFGLLDLILVSGQSPGCGMSVMQPIIFLIVGLSSLIHFFNSFKSRNLRAGELKR